jgi:hypothetical protein
MAKKKITGKSKLPRNLYRKAEIGKTQIAVNANKLSPDPRRF